MQHFYSLLKPVYFAYFIIPHLKKQLVCHTVLQAVGAQLQVIREGAPGGQLHNDTKGAEGYAYQGHDSMVVQVTHDGQLLPKVLVALHTLLLFVQPSKHLHCHWLTVVATVEDLSEETAV